jgi:hypothetical protein
MNDRQQDTNLRARFDAQREADASEAPLFAAMLERSRTAAAHAPPAITPRKTNLRRVLYWSSLGAAAMIGALLAIPRATSDEDAFEQAVQAYQSGAALGAWQSPTDGLLNVPGSQLISTVPSVGVN